MLCYGDMKPEVKRGIRKGTRLLLCDIKDSDVHRMDWRGGQVGVVQVVATR